MVFAVLALSISLGVCEAAVRWLVGATWIEPHDSEQDPLLHTHPTRGYALQPDLARRWKRADFDVAIETDEIGLRDGSFAEARNAALRVLAVGDSFTFGIGVEGPEAWPNRLEARLQDHAAPGARVTVVDAGVPGYSAAQMRVSVEELSPLLRPQLVIFGLYTTSYWRVTSPYVLHGGSLVTRKVRHAVVVTPEGTLVRTAFSLEPWRTIDVWLKRHFYLGAHLLSLVNRGHHLPDFPPWPRGEASVRALYAPALDEIGRAADAARQEGAAFALLMINAQEEDGGYSPHDHLCNRIVSEYCTARALACLDLLPDLEERARGRPIFRYPSDQHWTAAAHALAAARLEAFLGERGLLREAVEEAARGAPGVGAAGRLPPSEGRD